MHNHTHPLVESKKTPKIAHVLLDGLHSQIQDLVFESPILFEVEGGCIGELCQWLMEKSENGAAKNVAALYADWDLSTTCDRNCS